MNMNYPRGMGLARGRGRGRGFCYLDEARIEDLTAYDYPLRRGMGLRNSETRFSYRDGRGLRLRDGSCRYPAGYPRGMYNRRAVMDEIEREMKAKQEEKNV